MNSTLEALNRDAAAVSEWQRDETRREWGAMLARYVNPGRVHATTPQEGHAADFGPFETAKRVLTEDFYEANPADVCALLALVKELDALRERHDEFTVDRIVRRLKSTPPTGPRDSAETEYQKAGPFRAHLKSVMRNRIADFSATAVQMLDEILRVLEGHAHLMRETELEKAFAYGVRFIASHTLSEVDRAAAAIREIRDIWQRAPQLGDYTLLVRLTEHATPSALSQPGTATVETEQPAAVEVEPTPAPTPVPESVESVVEDAGFATTKQPKAAKAPKGK